MPTSLPAVGGYDGPFSLKAFLRRCFGVELRYGRPPPPATPLDADAPSCASSVLYLESTSQFAVCVYVAVGATAPPVQTSPPHALSGSVTGHNAATAAAAAATSFSRRTFAKSGRSPLLFTDALLGQHGIFDCLFTFLGPAATAFLLACCPLVLQFEPAGGGLQVLGPSLCRTAAGVVEGDGGAGWGKHFHDGSITRPRGEWQQRQRRGRRRPRGDADAALVEVGRRRRTEGGVRVGPAPRWVDQPPTTPSTSALLGRTEVPLAALMTGPRAAASLVPSSSSAAAATLKEDWLEALWLQRHQKSRQIFVTSCCLPAARCRRVRRLLAAHPIEANPSAPAVDVSEELVRAIFPLSFPRQNAVQTGDSPSFLLAHLGQLLRGTVEQCVSLDLRGACLRHTAYLERRCALFLAQQPQLRQRRRASSAPVRLSDLLAPVDIVVSYVKDLLGNLLYRSEREGRGSTATASSPPSMWGVDAESKDVVLSSLSETLKAWLGMGGGGATGGGLPLSSFLHRVPVAKIPWLACLYSTGPTPNTSASRTRRSMLQQRTYLQFMFFLLQQVVPFWLRRSFHVTRGAKGGTSAPLLFLPLAVWRRLLRHQVLSLRARAPAEESAASSSFSLQPAQLTPAGEVGTSTDSTGRESRTSAAASRLLYASLRFLPDKRKLRPIATVKLARRAVLAAKARGLPDRFSSRYALAARLARDLPASGLPVDSPSWLAEVPRGGGKRAAQASASVLLRHALQCLTHGIEERRRGGHTADTAWTSAQTDLPPPPLLPELRANSSHAAEYDEFRSFSSAVRCLAKQHGEGEGDGGGDGCVCVRVVRGDAALCYDRLSQTAAADAVTALVPHERYYLLDFDTLRGTTQRQGDKDACSSPLPHVLRRVPWRKLLSNADVSAGVLRAIPAGWIVQELGPRHGRIHSSANSDSSTLGNPTPPPGTAGQAANPSLAGDGDLVLDGACMRSVLLQHVQDHLVAIGSHVYRQHRGLVQGSPVAMLLCDVLLLRVEASLAAVLAEHHEPSLLMRRVDDVLVASTSAVAARRCWRAMGQGWPEVGYVCQQEKLLLVEGTPFHSIPSRDGRREEEGHAAGQEAQQCQRQVPWCGLLIAPNDLSFSVEWNRLLPQLASMAHSAAAVCQATRHSSLPGVESCLLAATHRLMRVVRLRTPATAVCRVLNGRERVVQTVYEAALLWAWLLSDILSPVLFGAPPPLLGHAPRAERNATLVQRMPPPAVAPALSAVSSLLTRPLHLCVHLLCRLLAQHHQFLVAKGSFCDDVTRAEVRLCAAAALSCTLRGKRPSRLRRSVADNSGPGCFGGRTLWWRLRHVANSLVRQFASEAKESTAVQCLFPEGVDVGDEGGVCLTGRFARSAWRATHTHCTSD